MLKAREAVMKTFIPHLRAHDISPQQWRVMRALFETKELEMTELSETCFLLMPSPVTYHSESGISESYQP